MPATYEKFGVHFLYPDNWNVADEELESSPQSVSVHSPQGGFWQLQSYPREVDTNELATQALAAMQGEYEKLEHLSVREAIFGCDAVGFDMSFFWLDFLVVSQVRVMEFTDRVILLMYQAESRDFDRSKPVFDAITKSLLDGMTHVPRIL